MQCELYLITLYTNLCLISLILIIESIVFLSNLSQTCQHPLKTFEYIFQLPPLSIIPIIFCTLTISLTDTCHVACSCSTCHDRDMIMHECDTDVHVRYWLCFDFRPTICLKFVGAREPLETQTC